VLGDIPYLGALFRYESRNRRRTNLMVFLRPVVISDEKGAASLTADRYEYIRNLQGEIKVAPNPMLPDVNVTPLPPLDAAKSKPLGTR
jgi:general secretion pathway protein D